MNNKLSNMGHSVAATVMSALQVRTGRAAKVRVFAIGALLTGTFLVSMHGAAEATTFNTVASNTVSNTNTAANIVTYVSYIGGAILAALGIVDLKKHVENPGQNPMKNGLAKLGFGAMLIALPFIVNATIGTMGATGSTTTSYQKFGTAPTL